ncbi:MAG: helix-turn-helix domain-containing protein [Methylococcaceae bacterium]|nr:helix-turn-helix domain-containing protein [Methylococcaceae bacterium]
MQNNITTLQDVIQKIDILTNAVLSNKQTLSIEEAAIYTALSVSYLYKLTSTQQIPHFKPRGKIIYFDRSELDEWLRQNRVKTTDEIHAAAMDHVLKGA